MKIAQFVKNQKSQVMIISIIIMALVFTLGAGLLFNSRTARHISLLEVSIEKAKSQAQSGMRITESFINQEACGPLPPTSQTYNLGDGTVTVDVDFAQQTITSIGRHSGSTNVIQKSFEMPFIDGWEFRRKITIDKLETHGIDKNLIDFPVLVEVTLTSRASQLDGGDIRFYEF